VSTNSGHCLNTNRTEIKLLPDTIQDDGRSYQSNVAKCQDKGCAKDYFHTTKFEGTSECSAVKKRLITSHKRAGLRMDDDPVPKALIDAMDDLDDFKPLLEALHTLQLV
jgi:hypothetical protein